MPRSLPRQLTVIKSYSVTPNMQRVVLGGEELSDFPLGYEGGYVKLLFPVAGQLELPSAEEVSLGASVVTRTYTVRHLNLEALELAVDFVLHNHNGQEGPASRWAAKVEVGSKALIFGPGKVKMVEQTADWYFLAGDMTALPAISCNLESMPSSSRGYAVIEINSNYDKQILEKPKGIHILWVVNPDSSKENNVLSDAVKDIPWQQGTPFVWAACEFSNMRQLRQYFKHDRKVSRENIYLSSYWKMSSTEEQHKIAKSQDAQTESLLS